MTLKEIDDSSSQRTEQGNCRFCKETQEKLREREAEEIKRMRSLKKNFEDDKKQS